LKNFAACIAIFVGCSGCVETPTEYKQSLGPKGTCVREIFRVEEINRAVCIAQSSSNPHRYLLFPRGELHGEAYAFSDLASDFWKLTSGILDILARTSTNDEEPSEEWRWRKAADAFMLDRYDGAGSIAWFRERPENRFEFEVVLGNHADAVSHHYRVHGD
jgi:hypothetical protein